MTPRCVCRWSARLATSVSVSCPGGETGVIDGYRSRHNSSTDWVASTATCVRIGEDRADHLQEFHDVAATRHRRRRRPRRQHSGDGVRRRSIRLRRHSARPRKSAGLRRAPLFAGRSRCARHSPRARGRRTSSVKVATSSACRSSRPSASGSVAQANAILCSISCARSVKVVAVFAFEDAGALALKGLPQPVRTFRVRLAASGAPVARHPDRSQLCPAAPDKPRVVLTSLAAALALAVALIAAERFLWRDGPAA